MSDVSSGRDCIADRATAFGGSPDRLAPEPYFVVYLTLDAGPTLTTSATARSTARILVSDALGRAGNGCSSLVSARRLRDTGVECEDCQEGEADSSDKT